MAQTRFTKPWIHCNAVAPGDVRQEMWLSFSRDVGAARGGDRINYDDLRSGIRFEYTRRNNKLLRLSVRPWEAESLRSVASALDAILRGDDSLGQPFPDIEFVKQTKRTLAEQGQRWIEYELEFRGGDLTNETNRGTAVLRVDPEQMLPASLTISVAEGNMQAAFDYPEDGPADIYALGVPRDAPMEDRLPPPDLEQILKAVDRGRNDLDDYFAVVFHEPQLLAGRLVWRKGDKWRIDLCEWNGCDLEHIEPMGPAFELGSWWQQHKGEFTTYPYFVCDGSCLYRYDIERALSKQTPGGWERKKRVAQSEAHSVGESGESRNLLIELRAYPSSLSTELGSWPEVTTHLDPSGRNGPEGSVRIALLTEHARGRQQHEFWLDPTRGYVLVKEETIDLPIAGETKASGGSHGVHEFERLRQSPRGVWYPTVVHWTPEGRRQTKYYHLDFNVELPDDLFTATPLVE